MLLENVMEPSVIRLLFSHKLLINPVRDNEFQAEGWNTSFQWSSANTAAAHINPWSPMLSSLLRQNPHWVWESGLSLHSQGELHSRSRSDLTLGQTQSPIYHIAQCSALLSKWGAAGLCISVHLTCRIVLFTKTEVYTRAFSRVRSFCCY